MPDPISVTTTFITLATFIKDLLDLGQSIKHSIDMVIKNNVFISELTEDVLSTLAALQKLTVGQERAFEAPQLLHALANLKARVLQASSQSLQSYFSSNLTERLAPSDGTGLRRLSSKFKAWVRRDDIEAAIQNLKELVNKCYIRFTVIISTAFSVARTEYVTLSLENSTIAYNIENSARLHRLEAMMAQLLLGTQFGNTVMQRTAETIASDLSHESLEWKYLSAQTMRLIGSLQRLTATNTFHSETSLWDPAEALEITFLQPASAIQVLQVVLGMVIETQDEDNGFSVKDLVEDLITLGAYLSMLGMQSEASASAHLTVHFLRSLIPRDDFAGVLPRLIFSLCIHSKRHQYTCQHDLALQASMQGISLCDILLQVAPEVDNSSVFLMALLTQTDNLQIQGLLEDAITTAEKAVVICRPMLAQIMCTYPFHGGRQQLSPEDEWRAAKCCEAFFMLGRALSLAKSYLAAHQSWKEGLERVVGLAGSVPPPPGIHTIFNHLCRMANDGALSLATLSDVITLHEALGNLYHRDFTLCFLPVLYAHAYICDHNNHGGSNSGIPFSVVVEPTPGLLSLGISEEFNSLSIPTSLIEKAIFAVYASNSPPEVVYPISSLIQYFFANDFDRTSTVLRRVLKSLKNTLGGPANIVSFAVAKLSDILPVVRLPHQVIILDIIAELVTHLRVIVYKSPKNTDCFLYALWWQFWGWWFAGCLEQALAVSHEAIHLISTNNKDVSDWVLDQAFVLFEMGHTGDAYEVLEKIPSAEDGADDDNRFYTFVHSHILRRMGRNQEALLFLTEMSTRSISQLGSRIIATDMAAVKLSLDQLNPALQCAETAVLLCREDTLDIDAVDAKGALMYALITLSDCLAAVGRHVDGLSASREAAALAKYLNEPLVNWPSVVRSSELKANAFHTYSLRLLSLAETKKALSNAENATALYRDLISLAPRHLTLLSLSLRNLASILWSVGRQDEAILACKEAVGITRQAVEREKHFLPVLSDVLDQLSAYLGCP
ncbi:hypothetical protein C8F04DRAFT_1365002 [Mycena alexandri]|uniref:Uncharacterized protein n=1 Tax=Mycena alexandri TaxID=1745969 RepID=A0AAD6X171_9AGAR|nr:hypothetical protein C8F04DRAFT_1365002 [Mycena alexandri]